MPVRLGSHLSKESEARIEIVPLIDIMFFLLASFMLVSLSMVHLNSVKVDLPTATKATPDKSKDPVALSVDREGMVFLGKTPMGHHELVEKLQAMAAENPEIKVFISGDAEARHGDIIGVLDWVRQAGIEQVGFETRSGDAKTN